MPKKHTTDISTRFFALMRWLLAWNYVAHPIQILYIFHKLETQIACFHVCALKNKNKKVSVWLIESLTTHF